MARGSYTLQLHDDMLTVQMCKHFSSIKSAREEVEEDLRAWELDVALRLGPGELHFVFEDAVVIDRDPLPSGEPKVIHASGGAVVALRGSAVTVHVGRGKYSEPPTRYRATPDVETLWQRFEGYRKGLEPLLSMAYFCLTLIEARAGGRQQAANRFSIDEQVLRKLGEITSIRGDGTSARKLNQQSTLAPITPAEIAWTEAAVKAIIRRVAELDPSNRLPQLTMSDLPNL